MLRLETTSPPESIPNPPGAAARDGAGHPGSNPASPRSPALSDASTADGSDDDAPSSPDLPLLPAPRLPARAQELLRSPEGIDDENFETASWGSPYHRDDRNFRRQSSSSEASDDSPIHHLGIDTRFLRPAPELLQTDNDPDPNAAISEAAAVLANRVRRQPTRGLTEDWIRTHTAGENTEHRHWFSEGSGSEHSSLSGSEIGWLEERDPRTPVAADAQKKAAQRSIRHPRGNDSIETLRPSPRTRRLVNMATSEAEPMREITGNEQHEAATGQNDNLRPSTPTKLADSDAKLPATPTRRVDKPLPKEPAMTPRIKKKVPWNGKNIMVLLPRDDERGQTGKAPMPLRQDTINKMYQSWEELGYRVDGFDLLVEGYQPPGTDDSQSREDWPTGYQLAEERSHRNYQVTLPDLNAWRNYVNELQEAKLRALGVSMADEEPPAPPSPPTTNPSRQASAQYPLNPFSPPLPASSASSNQAAMGFPFQQFNPSQSPGVASPGPYPGANGKFNPRQSISFPASNSPFQFNQQNPQWPGRSDSPSYANLNGMMSPQSPFGIEPTGSPGFNVHQRQQSLQYPMLPHQQLQQQQSMRASPRLQEVREDDEDGNKSPSKTPEPPKPKEFVEDADYHLEEQFREQLEHEDYNPQQSQQNRQGSGVPERFANEPGKPMVLHHPRPHSRGHSLTQNFYQGEQEGAEQGNLKQFAPMNGIPETQKGDENYEIDTNPSNMGTPNHNLEFSSFGHEKNMSTASNPWNDGERLNHSSKPSFSKLNVKAPEFKFNPGATFTPGQISFSGQSFQPTAFNAGIEEPVQPAFEEPKEHVQPVFAEPKEAAPPAPEEPKEAAQPAFEDKPKDQHAAESEAEAAVDEAAGESTAESQHDPEAETSAPAFGDEAKTFGGFSSFGGGNSEFSFSASGPKFRPDAPAFTPFQTVTSPPPTTARGHVPRESIFGNIRIPTSEIVKPAKKNKAIPIIRPTSRRSDQSPKHLNEDDGMQEDKDGFMVVDDSRSKRAKSHAPDGDDVPLFAERPKEDTPMIEEEQEPESEPELTQPEDPEPIVEEHAPADTSMSSAGTADQVDQAETKATTAAPSESSPIVDEGVNTWKPFEFDSQFDANNFSEARPSGESFFKESDHQPSLSADAQPFIPGGASPIVEEREVEPTPDEPVQERSASPTPKPVPAPKGLGLGASRFASPPPKPKGLAASRFANEPSPEPTPAPTQDDVIESVEQDLEQEPLIQLDKPAGGDEAGEPSLEEIDAIMMQMTNDPSLGINKTVESTKADPVADAQSSAFKLNPSAHDFTAPAAPREYQQLPETPVPELENPFVDPEPRTPDEEAEELQSPVVSDWEAAFSADEHDKLENRAQFFDGRVNEVVGTLLASRLEPLEQTLFSIQDALALKRPASSRHDARSVSRVHRQSDADDEDEEPAPRRSLSPRRDRKMDQIRAAVLESLTAHQRAQPTSALDAEEEKETRDAALLEAISEMKEHMVANIKPDFGGDELKNLIESAVQSRMPPPVEPDVELFQKMEALQSKVEDLEDKLQVEQGKVDQEMAARRSADDSASELSRQLQNAETRIEVEIMNKSVFDQRVADLEEKLRTQEERTEAEVETRRKVEDRLSEVQRLLRISTEEEARHRDLAEEKDGRIKQMEQANGKVNMKMALLEASQTNSTQSQAEFTNKVNALEADLRAVRQDNNHWRAEAERSDEAARTRGGELAHTVQENKHLQKSLNTLTTQLEENERLRESWRGKYMSLQDDMSKAAREISEENARRIKKDQTMLARQEVLDARLQAESKTRERLEVEMDRLQINERSGMRAHKECERLEGLLAEMRTENHKLEQRVLTANRDYEEARESGASEVKRTRISMQTELDSANHQVNAVREELEEHNNKLRAELDSFKLEADTVKARNEMLLEEAEETKSAEINDLQAKHQNELEDLQARYEQQRSVAVDDSAKTEQSLLERLSFSASKIEHYQDRIVHLEEKLEVAKEAAAAAAAAAKLAGVETRGAPTSPVLRAKTAPAVTARSDVPEKVSPQALRESIMVLQEQLQAREGRIEELEQTVAKSDPNAATKISKRDDEISWLRELLAVRHGDLQDIIMALSTESVDQNRVKDAAIRLKASLQMEEQERERAMNGGSAINLPNIAQSLQAATPKVAQTLGAAWGSWRKGSTGSFTSMAGRLNSPAARNATPSRTRPAARQPDLSGLMTPPASNIRQSPLVDNTPQPTAFGNTGRRYPSHGNTSGPEQLQQRRTSMTARQAEKMPVQGPTSPQFQEETEQPLTPPMMRTAAYDSDAQSNDFDDDGFFVDE